MSKKMLINASHPEENRVAIVVDGILSELDIEIAGQEQSKGNIYKAVVVRVETGLQAAFVDYGAEKLGFLQIGEIHPKIYPPGNKISNRPRIADILHRGQEILVQIVKEERGNKGAALTTYLSLPGRYMVLMPDSDTKGVSRKISDDGERKKLKRTMAELDLPEDMGYIVRTAGIGKDQDELRRDFDYLVRLYQGIVSRQDQLKAPAQIYQESNLVIRSIRDYFTIDMDEVLIDSPDIYQEARDFFALVMPELKHLVKPHRERRPIFSRYQIEEQIDNLSRNQIALPSGGSIVIDQTEALVAIDVNSGKMASESGIEATALKTNLEAAAEVGRQLRLRDLGGLIVIDFIDMRDKKNIRDIEQELRRSLKDDKAKVSVGRISQFGLMEMSRQRIKPTLSIGSYLQCPHCKGLGKIKSIEAQAVAVLRQVHTCAAKGQNDLIEIKVPVEVANDLLNRKRTTITELEKQLQLQVVIHGHPELLPGEVELVQRKQVKEIEDPRKIMPVSHANQIEVALAAAREVENPEPILEPETPAEQQSSPTEKTKKRRRRRRKPQAETDATQNLKAENQEPQTDSETEAQQAVEEKVSEQQADEPNNPPASPDEAQTAAAPAPAATRSRRSRPRKKPQKTEVSAPRPDQTEGDQAVASSSPLVVQEQDRPTPVEPQQTQQPQQQDPEPAQEEVKPKRRTRRTTKKSAPAAAAPTATGKETETSKETKPKQRTPRGSKKTTAEPVAQAETAQETEVTTDTTPQRRTRRSARKPTSEAPAPAEENKDTKVTEEAKPKRRTRRAGPKAATESTAPTEKSKEPENTEDIKPKPRTRRNSTKTAPESTAATEKSKGADDTGEAKPKRRTRRTSTEKTRKTPVSPASTDAAEDKG